jgi:hypothetical protein
MLLLLVQVSVDRRVTVAGGGSASLLLHPALCHSCSRRYSTPQPRGPLFHIEIATLSTLRDHRTRGVLLVDGVGSVGRHYGC